eukprot:2381403-Pyramimonas_sp.AAC.1
MLTTGWTAICDPESGPHSTKEPQRPTPPNNPSANTLNYAAVSHMASTRSTTTRADFWKEGTQ